MSYPINYPTPQGANVQMFYSSGSTGGTSLTSEWTKPQGASFVWFTLIGAGSINGGGSGAVTNFMCPAFLIPDALRIYVPKGGTNPSNTEVQYQNKNGAGYTLLTAGSGNQSAGSGGSAMIANYFTAMGFFQSVAGQAGGAGTISASTTTFLSGGSSGGTVTPNYGYPSITGNQGYFQMQPIIVGCGGGAGKPGAIGCGGGGSNQSDGGDGLVVIITW